MTTDSTPNPIERLERSRVGVGDDLRDSIMIAQINKQQMTVVAFAMNPPRQASSLSDIVEAQFGAGMCSIGVHDESALLNENCRKLRAALQGRKHFC